MDMRANTSAVPNYSLPPPVEKKSLQRIDARFRVKYYGFALCKNGDTKTSTEYATRAIQAAIDSQVQPRSLSIHVYSERMELLDEEGKAMTAIPIVDMRFFSRHRDHRSGKPKMIAIMANNRFNDDTSKPYQCFMFHFDMTRDATRLCDLLNCCCENMKTKVTEAKLEEERQKMITQLPGSPRQVRVGWS
eukprot:m.73142 g.73142  ORF g.73142 m.73142 type:complete len:190 (+) comp12358_c3_seq2:1219-1788(+)